VVAVPEQDLYYHAGMGWIHHNRDYYRPY
jgi:hypothetical protein